MAIQVIDQLNTDGLVIGVIEVVNGQVGEASPALRERAKMLYSKLGAEGYELPESKRSAVRKSLKLGGFSPTGRNRPAYELLIRDLQQRDGFHHINNVVDVNNVQSLEHLLPISIFDASKLSNPLVVRIALEGEGYVFNPSGHHIDLKRCIVCCTGGDPGRPVGSPIKDSMETKIFEGATHFLAIIYIAQVMFSADAQQAVVQDFAGLLADETGGEILQALTI